MKPAIQTVDELWALWSLIERYVYEARRFEQEDSILEAQSIDAKCMELRSEILDVFGAMEEQIRKAAP